MKSEFMAKKKSDGKQRWLNNAGISDKAVENAESRELVTND